MSAPSLPATPPVREAESGDPGYTVQQATRLTGLSEHTLYRSAVERGDPALAGAIVAQITCEHFSRDP
jgi:hypothetical protein